jgi:hypothetical protein
MGVQLTLGQKAWYTLKYERLGEDLMKQEHPSTPEEPFEVAVDGAYWAKQMAMLRQRGQIGRFKIVPAVPVNTFWDWGLNDSTFIWFHQRINGYDRFILDYEESGEAVAHYAHFMRETGFELWGSHFLPHDMAHRRPGLTAIQTLEQMAQAAGIKPTVIVPRIDDKRVSINEARGKLLNCQFDQEDCARGIACLDNYSKEWSDLHGVWKDTPHHSEWSNGADAFQQYAMMADQLGHLIKSGSAAAPKVLDPLARRRKERRRGTWRAV